MPLFEWDPQKYSVKVDRFDAQHKKLFDLINQLHDAMLQRRAADVMMKTLSELKAYTVTHFKEEEGELARIKYEGLAQQKTQHAEFVKQIDTFLKEAQTGGQATVTIKMSKFLSEWLQNHIAKEDRQYSRSFA